ncbi:relaxase/mobilization nuclease domain-containing protein [Kitasatospora sp. NPDC127116]|uniref:relaxase/mobilization nuclease domain-containing protein n=1 Tax=Kitasatospora sp. NPDC127116 TaxID=3345367 RepID=UPI003628EBE6
MIPDISTGNSIRPLLAYLYGPGRREEHEDPHLVAAWNRHGAPDPGRDPGATVGRLAARLDQHARLREAELGTMPPSRVWHCSLRAAPEDRLLTDGQWAQVAHRIVRATGLAPERRAGCRWVAVRHSVHHIHIAAVSVRPDGSRPAMHRDQVRAQAECRAIEAEWGLRPVSQGPRATTSYPTTAEIIKAEQQGWAEPSRVWLQQRMRRALGEAATVDDYATALVADGVQLRWRTDDSGTRIGYSLARPGDTGTGGQLLYFAAGRLDSALTLPRLRDLLPTAAAHQPIAATSGP